LAEVVATLSVERCFRRCPCRREVQAARAAIVPPVGDSGTHRDSGQGRGSDAASSGRLSAERLAERGARSVPPSEGSTAPDVPGGELGSPNSPISRWQHDIDSDRNLGAARSTVTGRCCYLCDRRLLESRSPRRVASADRRWRWPEGCLSGEPEVHTAVADGQITQFRTEAKSPENDERSTTRGIIAWRGGRCK